MKKMVRRFEPKRVTACTIVYIPELAGYWEQSRNVLEICLSSLRRTTKVPLDLAVLDNGSCPEVREFLVDLNRRGIIQILILSGENMGKLGAWNVLFPACPGAFIAYCDSDILFRPRWLERSLEIIDAFPEAGMVTGRPGRTAREAAVNLLSATYEYAETNSDVTVRRGALLRPEILEEFARSVASSHDPALSDPTLEDLELRRRGVSAYAYAGHYQFVCPRTVALATLPLDSDRALGGDTRLFDERLNAMGKLRLSVPEPLVHHLGNTLSPDEIADLAHMRVDGATNTEPRSSSFVVRTARAAARVKLMRGVMRRAYLTLFEGLQ